MLIVGIVMMFFGLAIACHLLVFTTRNAASALTYFALTIIAGVAIPNLTHITRLGGEYSKGKSSVGLDIQQAVTDVRTGVGQVQIDKGEVTQIKNQVQMLANQIKDADARVARSEQNVAQMQANVREAYRALFDTLVISIDTRNMFPPPPVIKAVIDQQLNVLAVFAFPNPSDRAVEWMRLNGLAIAVEPTPIQPSAVPTVTMPPK